MANPKISSMNGASTFISLCSFSFNIMHSFGKIGIDLFEKLKQDSCEFIMPSNSNIYFDAYDQIYIPMNFQN